MSPYEAHDPSLRATELDALAYICDTSTTEDLRQLVVDLEVLLINAKPTDDDYISLWDGYDLASARLRARRGRPRAYRGATWALDNLPYPYAANPAERIRRTHRALSTRYEARAACTATV